MDDLKKWQPVAFVILIMMCFQWIGPEILRYETESIAKIEYWRLLTGHWVHANWIHFFMNMAGLLLCFALTQTDWNAAQLIWRIFVLTTGISLAFNVLHPELGWYVGFSGVLFGLYILAAVASLSRQFVMSMVLIGFIVLKISLEQWSSVKITSSELIGVPVLVDAHLYGVLMATLIIVIQLMWKRLHKHS